MPAAKTKRRPSKSKQSKTPAKSSEKQPELSKLDKNIITVAKTMKDPTKAAVARKVVELGGANHIQTVYRRMTQKDYLHRDILTVRDYNREYLDRKLMPQAIKIAEKALKDKEMDKKAQFPYVKLAFDKSLGDTVHHKGREMVSIGAIDRIQVLVGSALQGQFPRDLPPDPSIQEAEIEDNSN